MPPPNALTLARPFITREAVKQLERGHKIRAIGLIGLALATDADGKVARKLDATSKFGKYADPIADQLMRLQLLNAAPMDESARKVTLAVEGLKVIGALALLGKAETEAEEPAARFIGKASLTIQSIALARLMNKPGDKFTSWTIPAVSIVSLIDYSVARGPELFNKA